MYNFRDTLLYNYKDSIIVSYDERTFPEENIEKYLNLFFQTDNIDDTAGLKYNFSIFNGRRISYSVGHKLQSSRFFNRLETGLVLQESKNNIKIENEINSPERLVERNRVIRTCTNFTIK